MGTFERAPKPCDRRLPPASRWERFLWRIGWYRVGGPRMVPRLYHICVCGWPMIHHFRAIKVTASWEDWRYIYASIGKEGEGPDA